MAPATTQPSSVRPTATRAWVGGRISERQTRMNLGIAHHVFQTGYAYDPLGNINRIDYPSCDDYPCSSSVPDRQVDLTYTHGLLTEVENLATQLSYQLGGMLHTVDHANGVTETVTASSNRFQRPDSISTSGVAGGANWDTGTYAYDGVGNIKDIDGDFFKYDRMSRLLQGAISVGGASKVQKMTYDVVGNITRLETDGSVFNTLTNPATNHLSGNGASYDAGGNVTEITLGGIDYDYTYDGLNRMKHLQSTSGEARVFLYDADDERIFNIRCAFGSCPGENGLWTATRPRPRQPGLAHARARRRQYLGVETRSCRYHC